MLTKKQFCKMMIDEFIDDNKIQKIDDSIACQSSTIGVCMEYLKLIEDKETEKYIKSRGGILYSFYDEGLQDVCFLTARELIEMLPD